MGGGDPRSVQVALDASAPEPLEAGTRSRLQLSPDGLAEARRIDVWVVDCDDFPRSAIGEFGTQESAPMRTRRAALAINAHALRRWVTTTVVGVYCGGAPSIVRSCEFCGAPHGRPRLADASLEFSVASSSRIVALALSKDRVGLDLEVIRPLDELARLTQLVLAPAERDLMRGAGSEAIELFYDLWTAKEAAAKAVGSGLAFPLHELDVSSALRGGLLEVPAGADVHRLWLTPMDLIAGFAATVAAATVRPRVRMLFARPPGLDV